jgi:hypothetical protein
MFLDALCKLAAAQQVTADAISTSAYDLGDVTPKRHGGSGEPIGIGVFIKAIGTNSGSTKLQAVSATADDGTTGMAIIGEVDLVTADIKAGKGYFVPIPPGKPVARYISLYHDITGTVDYTVDVYVMPQSGFGAALETYAKNYAV